MSKPGALAHAPQRLDFRAASRFSVGCYRGSTLPALLAPVASRHGRPAAQNSRPGFRPSARPRRPAPRPLSAADCISARATVTTGWRRTNVNRYAGLNGDPVNLSDPNGHKPTTGLEEASACDANPGCRSQSEQRSGVGSGATCLQGGLAFLQPANCAGPPPSQFKYCAPTDPNQVSCLLGRPSGTQPQVRILPKPPPRTQDQVLTSCFIAGMSLNAGDPEVAATGNPSLPIIRDIKHGNGTCAVARGLGMLSLAIGVLAPEEDAAVVAMEGSAAKVGSVAGAADNTAVDARQAPYEQSARLVRSRALESCWLAVVNSVLAVLRVAAACELCRRTRS